MILTLSLAGCSGSGRLSSSQLHKQATQACTIADRELGRIPSPASPAGTDNFLRRGISVLRPELAELRALRPPSDVADVYSASIAAFAKKLSAIQDTVRGLSRGEDPIIAIKTLQQQLGMLESQENGGWQALELPACLNH